MAEVSPPVVSTEQPRVEPDQVGDSATTSPLTGSEQIKVDPLEPQTYEQAGRDLGMANYQMPEETMSELF